MAQGDYWTESQQQAWQYVISAEESGLGEVAALDQYREGGGAIRTSSWVELWHRAESSAALWDTLYKLGPNDTVPESMYAQTGINYMQKYVATFKFDMRLDDGTIVHDQYRTVESSTRITLGEWKAGLAEAASSITTEYFGSVLEITSIEFLENENL